MLRFLRSNGGKALLGRGFGCYEVSISDNNRPISAACLEIAQSYWLKEAISGNELAQALIAALMAETLQRKCMVAFRDTVDEEAIKKAAVEAYRATLFGGGKINNAEYVELCAECREDHRICN